MTTPISSSILDRNLAALSLSSPRLAALIRQTAPRTDIRFTPTDEPALSATLGAGPGARQMASKRRPIEEARRLIEPIDVSIAATIVSLGFGLGHHVPVLLDRLKRTGIVLIFEPDIPLLRAVLERIDHSAWLVTKSVLFITEPTEAALADAARGAEALFCMGDTVAFVAHPADRARLGPAASELQTRFIATLSAIRTQVATSLLQPEITLRNALMNIDRYAASPGIADLDGAARGRPAIVVSAGPSLRRNIHLLAQPGIRDRFVIIAAQTVLKTLLSRGIRPHFVTALDYHEISRRFYEGLTARDVEGVTLVAMPWANPAILESFPGALRIPEDWMPDTARPAGKPAPTLDGILGPALARARGRILPGATVAHMAYYLARHLGCDPVILIGQDLGFTDGQYYAAGAAIHDVWSSELNPFNSLEAMEWQRIVRNRSNLHRAIDTLGRPIYTDEQMATYRVQFERDFAGDRERGLTIVDSTEGGVAKQGSDPLPLAEAIRRFAPATELVLPSATISTEPEACGPPVVLSQVRHVRDDTQRIHNACLRTQALLQEMLDHHADQSRVNELIHGVHSIRFEVESLEPAFSLVQRLNQTGQLKRAMADRKIRLREDASPLELQKSQIERDLTNVTWLGDAALALGGLLDSTMACLQGGPRLTREPDTSLAESAPSAASSRRIAALIPIDFAQSSLGTHRDLGEPLVRSQNPLQLTLARLARCKEINGAVLLTTDPARCARLIGPPPPNLRLTFLQTPATPLADRAASVRAGRIFARSCWRGGLGGLTIYDEVCDPLVMARVMEEHGLDAAALIGPDWAFVDPALVDETVARYRADPTGRRLTFCQAPPGLGCCVIDRSLMRELADRADAGPFATIGGLLGYIPIAPTADPISRPVCVSPAPGVRDAQFRFIPDCGPRRAALLRALAAIGPQAEGASAETLVDAIANQQRIALAAAPQEVILELCTGRRTGGLRSHWLRAADAERPVLSPSLANRLVQEYADLREDAALTIGGAGDPILSPDIHRIIALARRSGIAAIHIRTDLICDPATADALLESGVDIISVDLMADSASAYKAVMGVDHFDLARSNLIRLLERRAKLPTRGGLPFPLIVPRITRCDAVYEEIEPFFDRWIMSAGAAVIDSLPIPIPGDRIDPLPIPATAARRLARERMTILSDGRVPVSDTDLSGDRTVGDAGKEGLLPLWRKLLSRRQEPMPATPHRTSLLEPKLSPRPQVA